jgi:hypothetical protein
MKRNAHRILAGKHEGKRSLGDLDVQGRKILKLALKRIRWSRLNSSGLGLRQIGFV